MARKPRRSWKQSTLEPYYQWRRHEVLIGGGEGLWPSNPPTPKFRFLLGIRLLYFENLEKFKVLVSSLKKNFKKSRFLGGTSPFYFLTGGTRPPVPPGVGAHAYYWPFSSIYQKMLDGIVFFDLFVMYLNTNIRNHRKSEKPTFQRSWGFAVPVCGGR